MKIVRVQNPVGISMMKDKLLLDEIPIDTLCDILKGVMESNPSALCILHAWDGEDLRAFIIATDVVAYPHVFICQAWKDINVPTSIMRRMFLHLQLWADSIGKNKIRAETKRDEDSIIKSWGFHHFSNIIEFDIPEDFELVIKENADVRRVETKSEVREPVEQGAADNKQGDIDSTIGENGGSSSTNSMELGSSIRAGDASSPEDVG